MKKKTVLFVCIENSCRSQIAEGFAKKFGRDVFEAWSAGSRPSGKINSTAVALMKELGIDISTQHSKGLSDIPPNSWDYVITMGCGDACPFVPARITADWGIPDPKDLSRNEFLKVIRQIEAKVTQLIHEINHGDAK